MTTAPIGERRVPTICRSDPARDHPVGASLLATAQPARDRPACSRPPSLLATTPKGSQPRDRTRTTTERSCRQFARRSRASSLLRAHGYNGRGMSHRAPHTARFRTAGCIAGRTASLAADAVRCTHHVLSAGPGETPQPDHETQHAPTPWDHSGRPRPDHRRMRRLQAGGQERSIRRDRSRSPSSRRTFGSPWPASCVPETKAPWCRTRAGVSTCWRSRTSARKT